jgi:hypothetical protein
LVVVEGRRTKMLVKLDEAWKKFEKYANDKGYAGKILEAYVLCNDQGKRIKLVSVKMRQQKMVIWEENMNYYEMDLV